MDETSDIYQRKQKIRERYKGVNEELLDCIPSIPQEDFFQSDTKKRVAAYCRYVASHIIAGYRPMIPIRLRILHNTF